MAKLTNEVLAALIGNLTPCDRCGSPATQFFNNTEWQGLGALGAKPGYNFGCDSCTDLTGPWIDLPWAALVRKLLKRLQEDKEDRL